MVGCCIVVPLKQPIMQVLLFLLYQDCSISSRLTPVISAVHNRTSLSSCSCNLATTTDLSQGKLFSCVDSSWRRHRWNRGGGRRQPSCCSSGNSGICTRQEDAAFGTNRWEARRWYAGRPLGSGGRESDLAMVVVCCGEKMRPVRGGG